MGVYPAPSLRASSDGNEATDPVTPHVWAEHSVWTQDPQFTLALKGGITTFHVLPGSANLIGGRGVTLKNVRSVTVQGMKFPKAPYTLKMLVAKIQSESMEIENKNHLPVWQMLQDIEQLGLMPSII